MHASGEMQRRKHCYYPSVRRAPDIVAVTHVLGLLNGLLCLLRVRWTQHEKKT